MLLLALGVAAGCGGNGKERLASSALTATAPRPGPATSGPAPTKKYPTKLTRAYVTGCVKTGGSNAVCTCSLRRLAQTMSVAQFTTVAHALQVNRTPPKALEKKVRDTTASCATGAR